MEVLEKLLRKIVRLDADVIAQQIYQRDVVQKFIIDLNTDKQLREGKNAEGQTLGVYKGVSYSVKKQRQPGRKAPMGVIDLYMKGSFYQSFKVIPKTDGFEIEADMDIHVKDFREKDNIKLPILGLDDENKDVLTSYLIPLMQEAITKALFS